MTASEKRPVFQMSPDLAEDGLVCGYVFPSEVEGTPSATLVIPMRPGESGADLTKHTYEMAGMVGDEPVFFEMRYEGEAFKISHGKLPRPVRFSFHYPFDPFAQRGNLHIRSFPYLGGKKDVIEPYTHFVPILPVDIQVMDTAYIDYKMVFAEKTDVFPPR